MILIATVDENWALSNRRKPLVRMPADRRFFQEATRGKTVVMGWRTLKELFGGHPMPGRETVVLAPEGVALPKTAVRAASTEEVLSLVRGREAETFVTGGAAVYEAFLPCCTEAHITRIAYSYAADRHLENLEKSSEWMETGISEEQTFHDLVYTFHRYERLPSNCATRC